MKTKLYLITLSSLALFLFACSSPDVEVIKAEFAESIIYDGGVSCIYKDHHIIKITLNFNFQNLNTKEQVGTDAYSSEVYQILSQNAHLYNGDSIIKYTYGYWPKKTTKTSASGMVLFYVIPDNTDLNKMKFIYDASVLGGTTKTYTYSSFGEMKPLALKK